MLSLESGRPGRQKKLSTRFHLIADVVRETDYWARKNGHQVVSRQDVQTAIKEKVERVNLVERKIREMIEEGTILIDTQGKDCWAGQWSGCL